METKPRYREALDYIQNFIDYSKTHQENIAPENFELERMHQFLDLLGNPHQAYPIIHVAGTKGKGSVSALCAGGLQAAGYKVGLYTSPHLQSFTERIQVNRTPIPEADFVELVNAIKPVVEKIAGLTAYELQTALALLYFIQQGVDAAVLEVGMGGRLDSTNVVVPLVSVITSISLDHTFVLGDTLAEIAGEKGGIIKPGVPVVSAPQHIEAEQRLLEIANEHNARFVQVGKDVMVERLENELAGQHVRLDGFGDSLDVQLKLLGEHQAENAAVAYAVLRIAADRGLTISTTAIQQGFAQTSWPGRFEIVNQSPPVILDGAHNQDSAKKLVRALEEYFPGKPYILLFGASSDKDVAGMFAELLPAVHTLIATTSSHPRAMSSDALAELAQPYPCKRIKNTDISSALTQAFALAEENQAVLIATGSLYALGEVREAWFQRG